ncbi:hypothetical protein B0H65DRAFT_131277 [Neurospora tetraspora]|uniref:Uncharacterized protein n=1 Tax=Neurospora tetraspora TaxID=94610 RepID=A0AAE0MV64_9PEZI|nr:hypothetical protein B0H65DRAFT_131277 [Neurospora tetraspora]
MTRLGSIIYLIRHMFLSAPSFLSTTNCIPPTQNKSIYPQQYTATRNQNQETWNVSKPISRLHVFSLRQSETPAPLSLVHWTIGPKTMF